MAHPDLAAYIKGSDLICDLFCYARDNMPPHTLFLHANSVWDKELTGFTNKLNYGKKEATPQALSEFHNTLIKTVQRLKSEIPNYFFYLTDYGKGRKTGTTPHIFSGTPKLLYGRMQDNTSVAVWLSQATEKQAFDVGEKFVS